VEYEYKNWANRQNTKIKAVCTVFDETFIVGHDFVRRYVCEKKQSVNEERSGVIIDKDMVDKYPELLH
jgi:hypothetical protein